MFTKVLRTTLCVLFSALAFCCPIAEGQTLFGRISGTITDPSGAAVAGAKVTVTDVATQNSRILTTDDKGFYSADNLPVGRSVVSRKALT